MPKPSCRLKEFLGAALGAVLLFNSPAAAARLLDVYIEQSGKVVAHTYYDDNGRADAATVWRYLARPPLMVDDDVTAIEVDQPTLEASLTGDMVIRFEHADRLVAQARLSTLKLQRTDEQTQAWFLSGSEVERTAAAAGLGAPSRLPSGVALSAAEVTIFVVVTFALLGVVATIAFLFFRRAGPAVD